MQENAFTLPSLTPFATTQFVKAMMEENQVERATRLFSV
jgi:hypothetical protein